MPGAGPDARTPQQDHTPRQEEAAARERRERITQARAQQKSPEQMEEEAEQLAAASIGAQVILDYNEDGSKGARGGAGRSVEENQLRRDRYLVAVGLDPVSPSGPPPTPAQREARRKAQEAAAQAAAVPPGGGQATRMSSMAVGASEGVEMEEPEADEPPPAAA
jgi:hypothetical protein